MTDAERLARTMWPRTAGPEGIAAAQRAIDAGWTPPAEPPTLAEAVAAYRKCRTVGSIIPVREAMFAALDRENTDA